MQHTCTAFHSFLKAGFKKVLNPETDIFYFFLAAQEKQRSSSVEPLAYRIKTHEE
jgi:hypothetical protein